MKEHLIRCPRFGGHRLAASCCVSDRYRNCRKKCKSLEKHLQLHPDLPQLAAKLYRDSLERTQHANKGLPIVTPWQCKICGFSAISARGLKAHMTRTHKKRGEG